MHLPYLYSRMSSQMRKNNLDTFHLRKYKFKKLNLPFSFKDFISEFVYFNFQDAKAFGWELPDLSSLKISWPALVEAVQNHVKSVNWVTRVMLRDKYVFYL